VQCEICGRKSEGNFCELHKAAYDNLLKNYEAWKKSMKVSWKEYLTHIKVNEFSGLWVKEVAQHLLASDSSKQQGVQKAELDK
jgi:hypothetical protein